MERRRAHRRCPAADEPLSRARLRTGRELAVIDLSDWGALIEGGRLLPGTHVDVHLITSSGRVLVRGRVVRAFVNALSRDVVLYRSALTFERPIDTAQIPEAGWLTRPDAAAGYAVPGAIASPAA